MSGATERSARDAVIVALCSGPDAPTYQTIGDFYGVTGVRVAQIARRAGVRKVPVVVPVEWTAERREAASARGKVRWSDPDFRQEALERLRVMNVAKTIVWCPEMDAMLVRCYETMRYKDFRERAPALIGVSDTTMLKRVKTLGIGRRKKR